MVDEELDRLATLIGAKNEADRAIAEFIGRPATAGNIGEYVAARVFGIRLERSGSNPGHDGVFEDGPLAGKTVNVGTHSRHESMLDVGPHPCDFYLVLTGSPGPARNPPWGIDSVFLFETERLMTGLHRRAVKIGVATRVMKADWESARIFPPHPESPLELSARQLGLLDLFSSIS